MHPFNKRIFLKKNQIQIFNFTQYQIKTLHIVHYTASIGLSVICTGNVYLLLLSLKFYILGLTYVQMLSKTFFFSFCIYICTNFTENPPTSSISRFRPGVFGERRLLHLLLWQWSLWPQGVSSPAVTVLVTACPPVEGFGGGGGEAGGYVL